MPQRYMTTPRQLLAQKTTQSQMSSFFIDKIGYLTPKSYGAASDGVTDDTLAVQATVNAISTYGVIVLDNNYLAGAGAIEIPAGKTIVFKTIRPIICNTVDQNDSGVATNSRTFKNAGTVFFNRVKATNTNAQGGIFCDYLDINNLGKVIALFCELTGFSTQWGMNGKGSKFYGNDCTMREIISDPTNKYTFYGVHSDQDNISVIGNNFKNGRHHVYASGNVSNWQVAKNTCQNSWWPAIQLNSTVGTAAHHINIDNNILTGCAVANNTFSSILVAGYFNKISVTNNKILDFKGIGIWFQGTAAATANDNICFGNFVYSTVTNCPCGIKVTTCFEVWVKGNTISTPGNLITIETNSDFTYIHDNLLHCQTATTTWLVLNSISNFDVSGNVVRNMPAALWYDTYILNGIWFSAVTGTMTGKNNVVMGYTVSLTTDAGAIWINKHGEMANAGAIPSIYHKAGDSYRIINPVATGYYGQVCVSSGNSGVFKGYGVIQA